MLCNVERLWQEENFAVFFLPSRTEMSGCQECSWHSWCNVQAEGGSTHKSHTSKLGDTCFPHSHLVDISSSSSFRVYFNRQLRWLTTYTYTYTCNMNIIWPISPVNLSLGNERSGVTSPHHGQWSLVIPGAQGTPVSCAGPGQLSSPWVTRSLVSGQWSSHLMSERIVTMSHRLGCLMPMSRTSR